MSSERAGTPTRVQLDRDAVLDRVHEELLKSAPGGPWATTAVLAAVADALEACVVPDPRIKAVEAYFDRGRDWADDPDVIEANVRAILRGDE